MKGWFSVVVDLLTHVLCIVVGYGATLSAQAFGRAVGRTPVEQFVAALALGLVYVGVWFGAVVWFWRRVPEVQP